MRQQCWQQTFPGTLQMGSGTGGNLIVSTNNTLREYTQSGVPVSAAISTPPGSSITETARDIIVNNSGSDLIHVDNGTFDPRLSTYSAGTMMWNNQTHLGWSTVNNLSYGGITSYQDFIYVTDMQTFNPGGTPQGIVRFDLANNTSDRFAPTFNYIDLTLGLDGLLYAL